MLCLELGIAVANMLRTGSYKHSGKGGIVLGSECGHLILMANTASGGSLKKRIVPDRAQALSLF